MMSANKEHKKMYNVHTAAFDHMFKQHMNANIEIRALIIITLILDILESLRACLTLKNAYVPMTIPIIIPVKRYLG